MSDRVLFTTVISCTPSLEIASLFTLEGTFLQEHKLEDRDLSVGWPFQLLQGGVTLFSLLWQTKTTGT